jgi:hypothetical protein
MMLFNETKKEKIKGWKLDEKIKIIIIIIVVVGVIRKILYEILYEYLHKKNYCDFTIVN